MGRLELDGLTIESGLDYGSILLVALDGEPISTSAKLLLQVASEDQPYEWATSQPTGVRTITNRGTVPLMVKNFTGTVRLKRTDASAMTVVPLDSNGYRVTGTPGHADVITLSTNAAYYVIEK